MLYKTSFQLILYLRVSASFSPYTVPPPYLSPLVTTGFFSVSVNVRGSQTCPTLYL